MIYPTGGGTGLIGMWKAFEELEALGWVAPARGRAWSRCRPKAARPSSGRLPRAARPALPVVDAHTIADGLRVPRAVGDFLMLRAIRESGGTALAVSDEAMVDGMRRLGRLEGISAAPEGGAALAALDALVAGGQVGRDDSSCCSTPAAR